ncbi:MAG: glycosyltransferase, partial [Bdellovibrionota bacterium]
MNFLFVNYGDFTSNSLNHIGAFANRLTLMGHACVVAVPENPETISVVPQPLFTPTTFLGALSTEPIFPDRRPADVVHAWTPRENVREFTLSYLKAHPSAALIIHLEDNEVFLIESYARESIETLRTLSDEELNRRLSPRLSHPIRFKNFLRLAHGVTYITDRLRELIPDGKPSHRLLPGIDRGLYQPLIPDPKLREDIGVRADEKLLVFTGSTTFANLADVRALLLAVRLINDAGTPCKLVRTGINPHKLAAELAAIGGEHVIDLGFLEKEKLAPLLTLADVLVQPGAADAFNDYRLPSKIPEFLCVGRPVVIPRANLAREMEDGRDALLLDTGTPEEIAEKCQRIFSDGGLAQRLSDGALAFARTHFDLKQNTEALLGFYQQVKSSAAPIFTDPTAPASEDVLLADGDTALRMRAKELSITTQLQQIADLEAELQRLRSVELPAKDAEKAVLVAEASYHHAKIQAGKNQIEVLRGQLGEATSTLGHFSREL